MAYGVAQRRTEFGIRMALGAATIASMVQRQGRALVLAGIAIGIVLGGFGVRERETGAASTDPVEALRAE